jgi:DNA replication protein DnaC
MELRTLPPLPAACRTLTDADSSRLRRYGIVAWHDPEKTCLTCSKSEDGTFKARDGLYACDCKGQWKMHRWMLNAGIGTRYQRLSWVDATGASPNALQAVMAYVDKADSRIASGMGLTLGSPNTGTGKTMLSALLAKGLLAVGHDVYFTQFNDMLDAFSAGWRDEEERRWFVRRVRNAGVLVVDDIGREHKGRAEVAEAMFDTVIRHRISSSLPTIITTNYTQADMLAGLGGNVMSLLSEVNPYVDSPGVDFRSQAQARTLDEAQAGIVRPITVS